MYLVKQNCTGDTNIHACDTNLRNLIMCLEHEALIAIEWFESNYSKLPLTGTSKNSLS